MDEESRTILFGQLMEKIKFQHLDLPIIRSCNLACKGCMTHSDHKNIKGLVRVEESREWLKFWAERLEPEHITLFGGEPLLHPEFVDWALAIREIWGPDVTISLNTNGYYLDTLLPHIDNLFSEELGLSIVVSVQTGIEPYLGKVYDNINRLKAAIADYRGGKWTLWLDEYDVNFKRWYGLDIGTYRSRAGFTVCDQHKLHWCMHYSGKGETMRPIYDYNDQWYEPNHGICHTKNFVTLYKGRMYKCPPVGVLEHSLTTFGIDQSPEWAPYLQNYKTVGPQSTDEEISAWFEQQKCPEKVCNMCGFMGPNGGHISGDERSHILKNHWNYTL
jgi:hypothetical protein